MRTTLVRWDDVTSRAGRNDYPTLLVRNWMELDPRDIKTAVMDSWTMAEWPEQHFDAEVWEALFRRANYDLSSQAGGVTLYRGAIEERSRGMSWTVDLEQAQWFADRFAGMRGSGGNANVYTMSHVPTSALLADFSGAGRGEQEIVVAPSYLVDATVVLMNPLSN